MNTNYYLYQTRSIIEIRVMNGYDYAHYYSHISRICQTKEYPLFVRSPKTSIFAYTLISELHRMLLMVLNILMIHSLISCGEYCRY